MRKIAPMPPTQETVTQDPLVRLSVDVPDSAHRFIKMQAVMVSKTMGEFLTDLLKSSTDYKEPPSE